MIIGITGGTGSGKTTLLNMVRDLGGLVLDCDAIYHELLTRDPALLGAIEARFPGGWSPLRSSPPSTRWRCLKAALPGCAT